MRRGKDRLIYNQDDVAVNFQAELKKLKIRANKRRAAEIWRLAIFVTFELAKSVDTMLSISGIGTFWTENSVRAATSNPL